MAGAVSLRANEGISSPGVKLHGAGFIVTPEQARQLGLGRIPGLEKHIREYRNGRDLTRRPRGVMVIDLFGLSAEEVRERYPAVYQWVLERVKPERDQNNRASYRDNANRSKRSAICWPSARRASTSWPGSSSSNPSSQSDSCWKRSMRWGWRGRMAGSGGWGDFSRLQI